MPVFHELDVYNDAVPRSAAINMAVDEALLEKAVRPIVRFYRWDHPALSFGYFGQFADVADDRDRDIVRRWTGGGVVLHGEDLTYSLVIPAGDPTFAESSMAIYEQIHCALRSALAQTGQHAVVAAVADRGAGVSDASYNAHACFANPVRADVMMDGRKIAGAAQRRTRRGLLQQGSIQHIELAPDFAGRFAHELSARCIDRKLDLPFLNRAREIAERKYATDTWLRRR